MPTFDEITLAEIVMKRRREVRTATVQSQWCEACREAHLWCGACGSLTCSYVRGASSAPHRLNAEPLLEGANP